MGRRTAKRLQRTASLLPEVLDNTAEFGLAADTLLGQAVPIRGMAGDQQAATVGQACLSPGMIKSTYGTGCFALLNTGETAVQSRNKLLTTTAYRLAGKTTYASEGSIFIAGAAIQWLRDGLGIIADAAETDSMAPAAHPDSGVYMVPAFTGLGAPYWDRDARAAIYGLTRDSGPAEIVRGPSNPLPIKHATCLRQWPPMAPLSQRRFGSMADLHGTIGRCSSFR